MMTEKEWFELKVNELTNMIVDLQNKIEAMEKKWGMLKFTVQIKVKCKGKHRDGTPRLIVEFAKQDIIKHDWLWEGRVVNVEKGD